MLKHRKAHSRTASPILAKDQVGQGAPGHLASFVTTGRGQCSHSRGTDPGLGAREQVPTDVLSKTHTPASSEVQKQPHGGWQGNSCAGGVPVLKEEVGDRTEGRGREARGREGWNKTAKHLQ